ncbi:unnamed protein product [Brassica oleracea var. botrytis]|uniref:(rape) hypothetical protein n=1 Tax=Brassica napus TaxID=3708 RepID=A0A816JGV3_BRANA|nr:unnamed protein product [Brassica napus]
MDSDEVDSIQLQTLHPYHPGKILSIKEAFVTLTIYLEPKVHYLTEKSIEVLRTHTTPYTSQIMTIAKPHLEKVQVVLEPYTKNATALIGSPLIFIIKLLSAVSNQIVLRGRRDTAINKNQALDIDEANLPLSPSIICHLESV